MSTEDMRNEFSLLLTMEKKNAIILVYKTTNNIKSKENKIK